MGDGKQGVGPGLVVNLDDLTLQEKPKSKVDLADFPAGPLPFDAPAEQ